MHPDALKLRAEDHGCDACGTLCDSFMAVMFYILPAKLKRKRHKEREHSVIYCFDCYDKAETLPFLVDGKQFERREGAGRRTRGGLALLHLRHTVLSPKNLRYSYGGKVDRQ